MIKGIKFHKIVFYICLFLLPINLGKHLIFKWSYVNGILIDYLIPTFYLVDAALIVLLLFWVFDFAASKKVFTTLVFKISLVFLLSAGLSVIGSYRWQPSLYAFLRLILYFTFFLYIVVNFNFKRDFKAVLNILGFWVFILSLLGIAQWYKQGSVFNNYYFLGEQPYTVSTRGVATENVSSVSRVPSYGLFRHPNIFGGFLSVIIFWLVAFHGKKRFWMKGTIALGTVSLLLTFSTTAALAFVLSLIGLFLVRSRRLFLVIIFLIVVSSVSVFGFVDGSKFPSSASFYRRTSLQKASQEMIKERFLFGTGLNNFTVVMDRFYIPFKELRFVQPVHNIFILVLTETGIFGIISFLALILYSLYRALIKQNYFLYLSLLQILIIGSFDHYFFTIHQTLLLFLLTLGMAHSYN